VSTPARSSGDSGTATVADAARHVLGNLSPAERKVARTLLAHYPMAGLEPVAGLARRAGVSAPTALRFVSRLGFASYADLQSALKREITEELGSPVRRRDQPGVDGGQEAAAAAAFAAAVRATFERLPDAELTRAADLIAGARRSVVLLGGRFSRSVADYFATHLVMLRDGVAVLPDSSLPRRAQVLDLGRRDVLVVFDYRRYDREVIEYAARAHRQGASIVLFTDPLLSPVSEWASAVLPTEVEAVGAFDSLAPATAVVEVLVGLVSERVDGGALRRWSEVEAVGGAVGGDRGEG
jgi:DNA-binding MurR/RpiR family transcriptional regulator